MKVIDKDIRTVVPCFRESDIENKIFVIVIKDKIEYHIAYIYKTFPEGCLNLTGISTKYGKCFRSWGFNLGCKTSVMGFLRYCMDYWVPNVFPNTPPIYIIENGDDIDKLSELFYDTSRSRIIKDELTNQLAQLNQSNRRQP